MRKTILITGGSGLLGRNIAKSISDRNNVFSTINKTKFSEKQVKLVKINFNKINDIKNKIELIKPDYIIHTLGNTNVENCENNKKDAYKVNVKFVKNLSKICKKIKIKIIYISSDHIFDGKYDFYSEKSKVKPLNYYAKTKVLAEKMIASASKDNLIIRCNFFGKGFKYRKSFSDKILESLKNRKKIRLFHDVYFSPIEIKNLIKVLEKLIVKKTKGIINISSNENISKYEFGLLLCRIFGLDLSLIEPIQVNSIKHLVQRPQKMSLSNNKIIKLLKLKKNFFAIKNQIKSLKEDIKDKTSKNRQIPYGTHFLDAQDEKSVLKVLRSNFLTQGPEVNKLESKIAKFVGAKFAVAVSSASTGLHISYIAAGLKKSDNFLSSPITFVSTINGALFCGAKPYFSDIEKYSANICADEIIKNIKNRKVKLCVPVHMGGYPADMKKIHNICKIKKIKVIEDASHALGAKYKDGSKVGNCKYSLMTVFSLHPVKIIAGGEGGVITTNDKKIYENLKILRSHGIEKNHKNFKNKFFIHNKSNIPEPWAYEVQKVGFNYRLTDIQSALAVSQLKKINLFLKKRFKIAEKYHRAFKNNSYINPLHELTKNSSYHLFIVKIKFGLLKISKKNFMIKLREQNILTQVHYIPVPIQNIYLEKSYSMNGLVNSTQYYDEAISIPIYYSLNEFQQDLVIKKILGLINSNVK